MLEQRITLEACFRGVFSADPEGEVVKRILVCPYANWALDMLVEDLCDASSQMVAKYLGDINQDVAEEKGALMEWQDAEMEKLLGAQQDEIEKVAASLVQVVEALESRMRIV